jgi:drug/metabolite transporter (DMT)-like permease
MKLSPGAAIAFAAAVCFSAKAIFVKLAYSYGADAVTTLALRMLFAMPMLLAMAFWSSRGAAHPLGPRDWRSVILLGFAGYYLSSLLDFLGLAYISAGLERLILFLYPTVVALISSAFLGKSIGRRGMLALGLSYGGIIFAFAKDVQHSGDINAVLIGGALVFACTITYAIYIVGSGQMVGRIGAARFSAYATCVAAGCCFIQFAATRPLSSLDLPWQVYWHTFAMAVVSTVLPVFMMSKAIQLIGATRVSIIGAVGPVATIFLAYLFLGEPVTWFQLVGAALVLAGVLLIASKEKTMKPA